MCDCDIMVRKIKCQAYIIEKRCTSNSHFDSQWDLNGLTHKIIQSGFKSRSLQVFLNEEKTHSNDNVKNCTTPEVWGSRYPRHSESDSKFSPWEVPLPVGR